VSDEAEPQAGPPEASDGTEVGPLVILADAFAAAPEDEGLGSSLGREVVTLDPCLLDAEAFGQIGEAAAVVIPWDLGSQAGLDIVEALRSDERMQETPILMSAPEPTRAAVSLALKAGACGFIFEPLQAEEIRPHLGPDSSNDAASDDPETSPAREDPSHSDSPSDGSEGPADAS